MYHPIQEFEATGLVTAGISLRHGGTSRPPYTCLNLAEHVGDQPEAVAANRERFFQQTGLTVLYYCHQIHSTFVIEVASNTRAILDNPPEADGLVTTQREGALGVFTADCVPIFILDAATPAIGIAHAGWRGTLARIAVNTLTRMKALYGTLATNCQIHLGPSIQKCCYTVGTQLLTKFTKHFGNSVGRGTNLSLHVANVNQLLEIGVPGASISVSRFCTACRTDLFYSYRAENGRTGRMLSFIRLNIDS